MKKDMIIHFLLKGGINFIEKYNKKWKLGVNNTQYNSDVTNGLLLTRTLQSPSAVPCRARKGTFRADIMLRLFSRQLTKANNNRT